MNEVHFKHEKQDWETPKDLFCKLNLLYEFDVDVCASYENAKCEKFFSKEDDGLAQDWTGTCWCNPPYGREIGKWVKKAATSKATVVMLLPARTDTAWFHDWVLPYGEVQFLRGRITFENANWQAPFPSMIVVFKEEEREA